METTCWSEPRGPRGDLIDRIESTRTRKRFVSEKARAMDGERKKEKRNNGGIVFGWSVHGEESANHSVGNRIPGSKGWFDESRGWFSTARPPRCWPTLLGEGKGNDSGRAPALSRPVKALTRLHEFLFFIFYFSFFCSPIIDHDSRTVRHSVTRLLLPALITYGILYEPRRERATA